MRQDSRERSRPKASWWKTWKSYTIIKVDKTRKHKTCRKDDAKRKDHVLHCASWSGDSFHGRRYRRAAALYLNLSLPDRWEGPKADKPLQDCQKIASQKAPLVGHALAIYRGTCIKARPFSATFSVASLFESFSACLPPAAKMIRLMLGARYFPHTVQRQVVSQWFVCIYIIYVYIYISKNGICWRMGLNFQQPQSILLSCHHVLQQLQFKLKLVKYAELRTTSVSGRDVSCCMIACGLRLAKDSLGTRIQKRTDTELSESLNCGLHDGWSPAAALVFCTSGWGMIAFLCTCTNLQ